MIALLRIILALNFALNVPFLALTSDTAYAKGKKNSAQKSEKDEDEKEPITAPSPDHEDDDEGEGDPFLRTERATMKDQNCDPTFLLDLYRKYRMVNCLTTYTGICLSPGTDEIFYGVTSGATTAGTSIGIDLGRNAATNALSEQLKLTRAQIAELQANHANMVKEIQAVRAAYAGEAAAGAAVPATPTSIAAAEAGKKLTAGRIAKAVFKGGARGLLVGALVTAAWSFWDSEYQEAITEFVKDSVVTPVGCAAADENDPDFKRYVPLHPGTCRSAIYTPGHPKVLAFLELPMDQKLKILKDNRLVCGYYKSLNRELEQRIEKLNGRARIKNVQCNANGSDITFESQQRSPTVYYKIRRNPKTKEIESYSYEENEFGVLDDAATFDLTNQDDNIMVSKTRVYNRVSQTYDIIPNDHLVQFSNGQSTKAQKTFEAFRALRKYSRTLALCCDTPVPALKEITRKKPDAAKVKEESKMLEGYNKVCHPAWFGRSAAPAAPVGNSGASH